MLINLVNIAIITWYSMTWVFLQDESDYNRTWHKCWTHSWLWMPWLHMLPGHQEIYNKLCKTGSEVFLICVTVIRISIIKKRLSHYHIFIMGITIAEKAVFLDTVETLYNTINFCWSTHKRHSIARPKGRGMGCLLWVQRATYCVDLSILSSIKYLL